MRILTLSAFAIGCMCSAWPSYSAPTVTEWAEIKTVQGCLFRLLHDTGDMTTEKFKQSIRAKWSGPCKKGVHITGEGTMTHLNSDGSIMFEQVGRLVDGAWHGTVQVPYPHPYSSQISSVDEYNMGCSIRSDGSLMGCIPHIASNRTETAVVQNDNVAITPNANQTLGPESSASTSDEDSLKVEPASPNTRARRTDNGERYWLKGRVVNLDSERCGQNCPPISLPIVVVADDAYGSRQTGVLYPSDFTFGPPMTVGTKWQIRKPLVAEFYDCDVVLIAGTVLPYENAINQGFAHEATVINCRLNDAGEARVAELARD